MGPSAERPRRGHACGDEHRQQGERRQVETDRNPPRGRGHRGGSRRRCGRRGRRYHGDRARLRRGGRHRRRVPGRLVRLIRRQRFGFGWFRRFRCGTGADAPHGRWSDPWTRHASGSTIARARVRTLRGRLIGRRRRRGARHVPRRRGRGLRLCAPGPMGQRRGNDRQGRQHAGEATAPLRPYRKARTGRRSGRPVRES
jgi:hypothetical protein